jgi:uncharacterized protein (TIGR03067 family)
VKPLLALLVCLVGTGLILSAPAPEPGPKGAIKKEWKRLNGTWEMVRVVVDGKEQQEEVTVTLKDAKYTAQVGDEVVDEGTFKLDPTTTPKSLDITPTSGPEKGKTSLGLYEVKGDNLRICFAPEGKSRPKAFESKEGSGDILVTYKRVKSKD